MIYKFETDDRDEAKMITKSLDMYCALNNIKEYFRGKWKYGLNEQEEKMRTQDFVNHFYENILPTLTGDVLND